MDDRAEVMAAVVADHVSMGCTDVSKSLGIVQMPDGYALMLDRDETFFYWLRRDGIESSPTVDKWAIYRGAKSDNEKGWSRRPERPI
jgi:hypothetical protein